MFEFILQFQGENGKDIERNTLHGYYIYIYVKASHQEGTKRQ